MLVVLPISRADAHLTDAMEKAFQKFNPGTGHNLLVVAGPDARTEADVLLNKLRPFFANSGVEIFVSANNQGWPRACNSYFQQSTFLIHKYAKPNQGWLWMELDSVPVAPNWLTILEQEYYADSTFAQAEGRPMRRYMGAMEKTIKSVAGELTDAGEHMAPVGIYPADFSSTCPVLKSLGGIQFHFAAHIKWYPLKSLNRTSLIQNNRDTCNYRVEDGAIVCDSQARNAWDIHWNSPLGKDTLILHGCKDGSLIDVVDSSRTVTIETKVAIPVPKVVAKPYFQHITPYQTATLPKQQHVPVPPTPVSRLGEMKSTPVIHQKLPPPTVRKFGELAASHSNTAPQKYDDSGLAVATPVQSVPAPAPEPTPVVEALPVAEAPKVPTSYKRGAKKGKRAWTPEQRQAASERAKKLVAEGKFGKKREPVSA